MLPETADWLELLWTLLSLAAAATSIPAWRKARGDHAYARSHGRRLIARSFAEDVRNARSRLLISAALALAGLVAMTQAQTTHRTPSGWIILALIFGAPLQIVSRNLAEARTRRAIIADVDRADRGGRREALD